MKRIFIAVLALACSVAFSADVPASDDSIRELMEVTKSRELVDNVFTYFETIMDSALKEATAGQELSEEDQAGIVAKKERMLTMMRDELSWENLEPIYLEVYARAFTQEELNGMLAFYKSPAGAAVIRKMPVVLQETATVMQRRMGPMMARMQQGIEEAIAELQATKSSDESKG